MFSKEIIEKAKTATSAEQLIEMAKEANISISGEEAEQYYAFLAGNRELSDEELSMIAGGKGSDNGPSPKYSVGQRVKVDGIYGAWITGTIVAIEPNEFRKNFCYRIRKDDGEMYPYTVALEEQPERVTVLS